MIVYKIFIFTFASSILAQCDKGILLSSGGGALESRVGTETVAASPEPVSLAVDSQWVCLELRQLPVPGHLAALGLTYTVAVNNTRRAEAKLWQQTFVKVIPPTLCLFESSRLPWWKTFLLSLCEPSLKRNTLWLRDINCLPYCHCWCPSGCHSQWSLTVAYWIVPFMDWAVSVKSVLQYLRV